MQRLSYSRKKNWKATLFRILQPNHEQKFCSVYVILRFERIGKLTKIRIIRQHLAVNFYTLQLWTHWSSTNTINFQSLQYLCVGGITINLYACSICLFTTVGESSTESVVPQLKPWWISIHLNYPIRRLIIVLNKNVKKGNLNFRYMTTVWKNIVSRQSWRNV